MPQKYTHISPLTWQLDRIKVKKNIFLVFYWEIQTVGITYIGYSILLGEGGLLVQIGIHQLALVVHRNYSQLRFGRDRRLGDMEL